MRPPSSLSTQAKLGPGFVVLLLLALVLLTSPRIKILISFFDQSRLDSHDML